MGDNLQRMHMAKEPGGDGMSANERMIAGTEETLDFDALVRFVWTNKYLIFGTALVFACIATVLAMLATNIYRAEAVIVEVSDRGGGDGGMLANKLGGLAGLAGINLAGAGTNREAQAVLRSRRLVEEFIKRNDLQPILFPPDAKPKPTLWYAVNRFRKGILSIREEKRSGLTVINIEWSDPVLAARWANGVVVLANELLRAQDLSESTRNIAYLNEQIEKTNRVELRQAMYKLIESETKTLMLANGRVEYAFTIVDPAVPPEQRVRPQRSLMVLGGGVLGILMGTLLAFVAGVVGRQRRAVRAHA